MWRIANCVCGRCATCEGDWPPFVCRCGLPGVGDAFATATGRERPRRLVPGMPASTGPATFYPSVARPTNTRIMYRDIMNLTKATNMPNPHVPSKRMTTKRERAKDKGAAPTRRQGETVTRDVALITVSDTSVQVIDKPGIEVTVPRDVPGKGHRLLLVSGSSRPDKAALTVAIQAGQAARAKDVPAVTRSVLAFVQTLGIDPKAVGRQLLNEPHVKDPDPPAADAQRDMARRRLQNLSNEFLLLDSRTLDERRREAGGESSPGTNPSATPTRWEREGKISALRQGGRNLYPGFQFDASWSPLPVVRRTLQALGPRWSGESVALWFTARNGWLDGARPVDLLQSEPDRVVTAAEHAVHRPATAG